MKISYYRVFSYHWQKINYRLAYYLYALARRRRWLAGQIRNNGKIELDPISTEDHHYHHHILFVNQQLHTIVNKRKQAARKSYDYHSWLPIIINIGK